MNAVLAQYFSDTLQIQHTTSYNNPLPGCAGDFGYLLYSGHNSHSPKGPFGFIKIMIYCQIWQPVGHNIANIQNILREPEIIYISIIHAKFDNDIFNIRFLARALV